MIYNFLENCLMINLNKNLVGNNLLFFIQNTYLTFKQINVCYTE